MWRRWFQFRLATLLAFVTLSAVGVDYGRRRSLLLHHADLHAAEAATQWQMAQSKMTDWMFCPTEPIPTDEQWRDWQAESRQRAIHHDQLATRYRRGAWCPWLMEPAEAPPIRYTLDELLGNRPPARRSLLSLFE